MYRSPEQFDKAAEDVKNLKSSPSDADLLELYANFKQATVGDCNTDKPGFLDFKGKAKWEAWNAKKGVTKDAAMEAYVQKANSLIESIGLK
ncbi:acyl-CoA-binding protein isoform X2 [Hermetia illucens]|uniref:acyl-CoA-binding protein isoform X2 n=1 Tax=Hermetia illucens TaxID=343691 RepID=UPI0018CC1061|nr:acyl-CoA-binding protein isoform X2 [Hermetia illucens]